ncbi:FK506-binding protein 2 [Lingula anatina]|uniref:peptidylprolyl isomerase n=1 Tax=Lingula anatina TaxID=7574 RepID=A0A1S3H6M9_LINAN|nr:FK506-binding protein 2 [Lingula anatina]|eukprot:XP_013381775.1 FK506-binding protein 2 [Lingula anatina]
MNLFKYLPTFMLAVLALASEEKVEEQEELQVETVFKPEECERKAKPGDMLSMHYTGTLKTDGSKFDSSHDRNEPFKFQLGAGQVIQGWDRGLTDICIGEKRKLVVPSRLGYGDQGAGDKIPGGATLMFDVECVGIEDGPKPQNIFKDIDENKDNKLSPDEVSDFIKKQMAETGSEMPGEKEHNDMVADIFKHEDKDRDGVISFEEFSGPKHDEL